MSLHLPIAIVRAVSLPSGDCVVGPYDGPLMGIRRSLLWILARCLRTKQLHNSRI